jgi:hypothetical protein
MDRVFIDPDEHSLKYTVINEIEKINRHQETRLASLPKHALIEVYKTQQGRLDSGRTP